MVSKGIVLQDTGDETCHNMKMSRLRFMHVHP